MNQIEKGATDITRYVVLRDSTTGAPETGYTITDLDLQYTRNRTAPAAKVDAVALAATDTAHTDNRAIEVDATSSPGLYRIDWPDAIAATGVDKVLLCVSGTGIEPAFEELQLVEAGTLDPSEILFVDFGGVPKKLINPSTGTDTFVLEFQIVDHNNEFIAPDSLPTATLVDQDGSDVSGRIDTPSLVDTGRYQVTYTSNVAHADAQLTLGVTAIKSGYVGGVGKVTIMLEAAHLSAAQVNAEVDAALTDYDAPTNTEMVAAFTAIKGATWDSGTDTLEHIRDKQTDIETDTDELQSDWADGGRLDLILDAVGLTSVLYIDFGGVPQKVVNPASGTDTFVLEFQVLDHNNEFIAPDSIPTVTLVDQDGSDVSGRLDTPALVDTGRYQVTYTANSAHAAAQLTFGATAIKSGYAGGAGKVTIMLEADPSVDTELADIADQITTADAVIDLVRADMVRLGVAYEYESVQATQTTTISIPNP